MSRVGKAPISLPKGVEINVSKSNLITVKGPKGELMQSVDPDITVSVEDGTITLSRPTEQKRHKALHGLYRSLIANMVEGVSDGFKKSLELIGVGYKVENRGNLLELNLGYSHPIYFFVPSEINVQTVTERGAPPRIHLESHDKQLIGQVAAKIRALRKPEPFKGKGVKYMDEIVRRKAGKTAGK